jgi:hypothetical protein
MKLGKSENCIFHNTSVNSIIKQVLPDVTSDTLP